MVKILPDLSLCDQEPIHIPGSIQPRGVLLALRGSRLRVTQVSRSSTRLLGLTPEELLGQELQALLGAELTQAVHAARRRWQRSPRQPAFFVWQRPGPADAFFSASVHESGDILVLELEPELAEQPMLTEDWFEQTQTRFAELRAEPQLEPKLAAAAELFRELTGYDRVMIYRFDADWHGEVVAEAHRMDMESYLGLHYPASDIPQQARRLYTISPTRMIADIKDEPSPLIPLCDPDTGGMLDLSLSLLRSVSPVHLEYLDNMGVRATLTASLVCDGKLWGLIACHHLTPRALPRRLHRLLGWMAQDLAIQIALSEEIATRRYREKLKALRKRVMAAMRSRGRLAELITGPHLPNVLGAVSADGVALIQGEEVVTGGRAPNPAQIRMIADTLAAQDPERLLDLFATDCISERIPEAADLADTAAGLLMQPLTSEPTIKLLWFRAEKLQQVTWGGDPHKAATVTAEGRLNPRKSFAAWCQNVQLHSARWQSVELESARELAALIDIERRKIAEAAVRDSEARFRSILTNSPAIIFIMDLQCRYLLVNRTFEEELGLTMADVQGNTPDLLFAPALAEQYLSNARAVIESLQPRTFEETVDSSDGGCTRLSTLFPLLDAAGRCTAVCCISLDITERKQVQAARQAEAALRESHRELQRRAEQLGHLTSELTLAEQRERERLAKVVHDHLQQLLVGVAFGIDRIGRCLSTLAPEHAAHGALASAKDLLEQAIDAARTLVADLSPPILHDSGLPDAIEWLARNMHETQGLTLALDLELDASPTREDVRSVVFESVREALFNVVKHAQCDHAEVRLAKDGADQVRIVIRDQGVGFDLQQLARGETNGTGFGLLSMRERLRFLGGFCSIESAPGEGTSVTLIAPLGSEPTSVGMGAGPDQLTEPLSLQAPQDQIAAVKARAVRVLLVDDHAMVRHGLSLMLNDEPDLDIVGEACDGIDAIAQCEQLQPDLVLMDYSMPRMDGLEATQRIKQRWPDVRVIGLSMYREADRAAAMLDAGACAYVDKTAGTDALLAAVRGEFVPGSGQ